MTHALYLAFLFIAGVASTSGGSMCICRADDSRVLAGVSLLLAGAAFLMLFFAYFAGVVS